jgi:acyl carrier protein
MGTAPADATGIVLEALAELNSQRGADEQISTSLESPLFGATAKLDSLGLVTLLLEIEDRGRARFQVSLTLADERAMSESRSPFRTLSALAEYVAQRIAEARAGK